jgi:hypothetical protein
MILRRLSQSLKEQNWMAITIEFVLLVVGVFLGIQVSNWNAERADRHRAEGLFVRLIDDMEAEKLSLGALRDYYATTSDYAATALRGMEIPGSVDDRTFVIGAYQASQWQDPITSRSTFDELVSTGALNLVTDARTRTLLVGYYEFDWTKSRIANNRPPYRELVRGSMPDGVQQAIQKACGDRPKLVGRVEVPFLQPRCSLDLPERDIARAAAALRATPGFEQALRYQLVENRLKTDFYSRNDYLAQLIAAMKRSQG